MKTIDKIENYCKSLRLPITATEISTIANRSAAENRSHLEHTLNLLEKANQAKEQRSVEKRIKDAQLPLQHDLSKFDCSLIEGMPPVLLNQIKELTWIDQSINLVIMGPSGVGKSMLSAGICSHALHKGYKAYFRRMETLMSTLYRRDVNRSAAIDYNRLIKADLIIIDDVMMIDPDPRRSNAFFHFINEIYENTSIVITTNKSPKEWVDKLGDEVLTAAVLDRILHHSEIIKLSGQSQRRMQKKASIFKQ